MAEQIDHSESEGTHDPVGAFRVAPFRWFFAGNLLFMLGTNLQAAVIAWELYERTGQLLHHAYLGLVQVIPVILLAIPIGQLVDRVDRRWFVCLSLLLFLSTSIALAVISLMQALIWMIFSCVLANGVARVMQQPAKASMLPHLVPRNNFANAVSWSSTGFQLSLVAGPAAAGFLLLWAEAYWAYLIAVAVAVFFVFALTRIPGQPRREALEPLTARSLLAGIAFLRRTPLVFGAITLDMFAVLLGGATALLPAYSSPDILDVGPTGYGWLRSAPGIGAILMSLVLTSLPPMRRAGTALLVSVAVFGVATIGFGLSRSFPISLAMLLTLGAFDMVSVIIRHTLIQLWTPDEMRGRVSAVNGMFISVSNELGSFESGFVAHLFSREDDKAFGPTVAAVSGGVGTLLVVALMALLNPQLRRHGRLDQGPQDH